MSETAPLSDPTAGRVRVLVCEDQGVTALRLQTALGKMGYDVSGQAKDGEEAVHLARRLRPDVVLMDVRMPRLDGLQALDTIMRECPTPVVVVTGHSDQELVRRALDAGASGYLVKPIRDEQLRSAILMALNRFAQLQEAAAAERRARELETERDAARSLVEEARRQAEEVRRRARELRRQLRQEREVAKALAESFLCPTPRLPGFQVGSRYEPASEVARVGGDYFDFIELPENRMGVVIGDVCGKGLAAASYTAMARHVLRAYALEDPAPSRVLRRLNHALYEQMSEECAFLTLVYGVLDLWSFSFEYANAGHVPPILYEPRTRGCRELAPTGSLLGAEPDWEWRQQRVFFEPGASLALFTDGVTEARAALQMLGSSGVRAVIEKHAKEDASRLAAAILERARDLSGSHLQDDAAVVVIRRLKARPAPARRQP